MKRQQYYRNKYRKLKPDWKESQDIYISLVDKCVNKDTKILDVGCGHGDFMKRVYRKTAFTYGLDPDMEALKKNKIIKNKVHGTVEKIPFPDNFFDIVASAWTLEHLEKPLNAFSEIYRVLKPKGKVIFLTPNARNYNVWIIRLIPELFHDFFTQKLYGRQEQDTFRTYYRINSVKKINAILNPIGFREIKLILNSDPSYISFNNILFTFSCFIEDILDRRLKQAKVHIIGVCEKQQELIWLFYKEYYYVGINLNNLM